MKIGVLSVKIVAVSDVHSWNIKTPEGDVLVCAGDMTDHGSVSEVMELNQWLARQPQRYKILIAGNHDLALQDPGGSSLITNAIYLCDTGVTIEGVKFYGSPWVPYINGCFAFEASTPGEINKYWNKIPEDTDVLITHAGPSGIMSARWGDYNLKQRVLEVKPKVHIFGHVHSGHGRMEDIYPVKFYNVAICDETNSPVNDATIIEINK